MTVFSLAGAAVAAAHAALVSADPAQNTELRQAPARVTATFDHEKWTVQLRL